MLRGRGSDRTRKSLLGDRELEPSGTAQNAIRARASPLPTADDEQWVAVDLKPVKALKNPVPLAAIRYDKRLSQLPLIRQSQLSVMSLTKDEFDIIVATGDGTTRKKSAGKK